MESDGKMHRRNSFFTDFSMSSPLSTLTFPINFYILHSFVPSLKSGYLFTGTHILYSFSKIFVLLVINNYYYLLPGHAVA